MTEKPKYLPSVGYIAEVPVVKFKYMTENYDEIITWAGTRSTQKENVKEGFVGRIAKRGHLSLGRFAQVVMELDCSRVTECQMLRHAFLDFCIQSGRYTKYGNQEEEEINLIKFIIPQTIKKSFKESYMRHLISSLKLYDLYLESGVPREDARYCLPISILNNIAVVGNLQAWRDYILLRLPSNAQWEIRYIAVRVTQELRSHVKGFFDDDKITELLEIAITDLQKKGFELV